MAAGGGRSEQAKFELKSAKNHLFPTTGVATDVEERPGYDAEAEPDKAKVLFNSFTADLSLVGKIWSRSSY
ncbi:hypothetical protein L3X38_037615 [Prunus dulcis]|uniref:Uncharacterized protein n=1 Tax=Prunus dulcis TaxID=3755 RepID=A0AAD4V4W0_PRUDU|nr:hypothetical protein L3X38_037615 [Prunus dulcis]